MYIMYMRTRLTVTRVIMYSNDIIKRFYIVSRIKVYDYTYSIR